MEKVSSNSMKLPIWVPGDWNAFFGLGINSLTNLLVLSGLLLGVVQMPPEIVFGRIVPAVGAMLVISNVYYFFMARAPHVHCSTGNHAAGQDCHR
jgi:AGZA family xanthine/uracil permease-like MFS transporter